MRTLTVKQAEKWLEKGMRGIYLGFIPTLLREMTALSIYFGTYELGKNRFIYNSG